jgi:AGZA family xanthine/uracil permease-like MFS transporter
VANVPYAQAPGMGLNAFFLYTVVFTLGFTWQQALSIVFITGIINILITVTKLRRTILFAIPKSLQNAIGGGLGVFIAYIGVKNAGWLQFTASPGEYVEVNGTIIADSRIVPELVHLNSPPVLLSLFGLVLIVILLMLKIKGALLIGILITTLLGIPLGVTSMAESVSFIDAARALPSTFGVIFTSAGLPSLLDDLSKLPLVLMTVFAFSLSDTFDSIGTFIGTGRRSGIFDEADEKAMAAGKGFNSKMDKALFADATATSIGAVFGTSNTTTFVESAAGIEAGGRTGLTSVFTAACFALSAFLATFASVVPGVATAPILIIVGVMMMESFLHINWGDLAEAIPAFFASIFMAYFYSISYGIAFGFTFYCIIKLVTGKGKEVHPVLYGAAVLFILNFVLLAVM